MKKKKTLPYIFAAFLMHNPQVSKVIPDKKYIKILYRGYTGKKLNLDYPETFNEKLQWLKLHDRKDSYVKMVDKYEAKKYVEKKIGNQYVVPTLGVFEKFDDINFDELPNKFVIKCTHDSGGLVICKDKENFDEIKAKKIINKSLRNNFYWVGREWPYKNIKPRIIVEEYVEDEDMKELADYKFFCFNGVPKALFIATDRQNDNEDTKFDFYDMDFNNLHIINGHDNAKKKLSKPKNFEKMKKLAAILSNNIPQLRVDFYEVNGKILFGELTFFHWSGLVPFEPEKWDRIFGDWVKLPRDKLGKKTK